MVKIVDRGKKVKFLVSSGWDESTAKLIVDRRMITWDFERWKTNSFILELVVKRGKVLMDVEEMSRQSRRLREAVEQENMEDWYASYT